MSEISINLSDTLLVLDAKDKYYLNINLPHPIISSEGKAKYIN